MKDAETHPELKDYTSDPTEFLSADNEYRDAYRQLFRDSLENIKSALCAAPSFIAAIKAAIPRSELRAVLTPFQKRLLNEGVVEMCVDKKGRLLAVLRNTKNGQWAGHIELKDVLTTPDLLNALTNFTMQMQLAQMVDTLENIHKEISDLCRGQENDRLAEAYACRQNLLTALHIKNNGLRKQALLNVAQQSEAARQKLMLSQKDSLDFIENQPDDFIGKLTSHISSAKIEEQMDKLYIGLNAINTASMSAVIAYQELGEPEAAAEVLKAYSHYLSVSYARPKMIECLDLNSERTDSFWSKTLSDVQTNINSLPLPNKTRLLKGEL